MAPAKLLLSIVELGGYPNFSPLYQSLGYTTVVENRMRKAIAFLRRQQPDVIVTEFNFQSDFRDRTSNLETLMAVLQRHPEVRVIVFYLPEQAEKLAILEARFPLFAKIAFPITAEKLEPILLEARDAPHVRS